MPKPVANPGMDLSATLRLPEGLPAGGRLWVALSGGMDSVVLLHALRAAGHPDLRAVHVHHGLQPAADRWVRGLRQQCREWQLPLRVCRVTVAAGAGRGVEAAAREARYVALGGLLRRGDVLATAHHQDDQAETVLLRALRGSGVDGLAAMAALSPLGRGQLWRPLLDIPRAALRTYARQHGLAWVEDPHNADPQYARSYLRTRVWPLLDAHWPAASANLARLAGHARESRALAEEWGEADLAGIRRAGALSVSGLLALSPARRRNALRQACQQAGWPPPAAELLDRLDRELLRARPDAQPCLRSGGSEWRRYRDGLYLMPALPASPPPDTRLAWKRAGELALPPGCGRLSAEGRLPAGLVVGFARGGERLRPAGGRHHRTIKQLCQEAGLPTWVRERMPLVHDRAGLLSIAGLWSDERLSGQGWKPVWSTDLAGFFPPVEPSLR